MPFCRPKSYCVSCRFRSDICVCARAATVAAKLDLPLRITLIMHAKENRKTSNTGHLIRLALRNTELRLHGFPNAPIVTDDLTSDTTETLCLFPSRGGLILTPETVAQYRATGKSLHLVVPDGNWGQTTRMLKRLPDLRALQRVELPSLAHAMQRSHLRQRRNLTPERISTYEAIAATLGMFFGEATEQALLELYDEAIGQMMLMRGKLSLKDDVFKHRE